MHPNQRVVTVFGLADDQHAVDRHAGGEMGEQVLTTLFSQGAGEMFDFTELSASDARIPLHGGVSLTASQWQGNGAHQVEVQARPRRFCHLHLSAIGVDTEQFAVSNQSLADLWIDVGEHGGLGLGV